ALFPRSFIVNLPAPSNYVGPSLLFGADAPNLVRLVDQTAEAWIPEKHDSSYIPTYDDTPRIPPSLENALLSFMLTCAARRHRGQRNKHNSMLVHVSRFKEVQRHVHAQIATWLDDVRNRLRYRQQADELLHRLR